MLPKSQLRAGAWLWWSRGPVKPKEPRDLGSRRRRVEAEPLPRPRPHCLLPQRQQQAAGLKPAKPSEQRRSVFQRKRKRALASQPAPSRGAVIPHCGEPRQSTGKSTDGGGHPPQLAYCKIAHNPELVPKHRSREADALFLPCSRKIYSREWFWRTIRLCAIHFTEPQYANSQSSKRPPIAQGSFCIRLHATTPCL